MCGTNPSSLSSIFPFTRSIVTNSDIFDTVSKARLRFWHISILNLMSLINTIATYGGIIASKGAIKSVKETKLS